MSPEEKEEWEDFLSTTIRHHVQLDPETHKLHHDYLDDELQAKKIRRARCEAVIKQVSGWGVIVFLTGIGYAVWEFIQNHIVHK